MHRFMLWIGSWVSLGQSIAEILSLGLFRPNWEMQFLMWETIRNLKTPVDRKDANANSCRLY